MSDTTPTPKPSPLAGKGITVLVGIASAMLTTFWAIQGQVETIVGAWIPRIEHRIMQRVDSLTTAQMDAMLRANEAHLQQATTQVLDRIDSLRNDVSSAASTPLPRPRITVQSDTAGDAMLQHRLATVEEYQARILEYLESEANERERAKRTRNRRGTDERQ